MRHSERFADFELWVLLGSGMRFFLSFLQSSLKLNRLRNHSRALLGPYLILSLRIHKCACRTLHRCKRLAAAASPFVCGQRTVKRLLKARCKFMQPSFCKFSSYLAVCIVILSVFKAILAILACLRLKCAANCS